jgi:hypothetical protein
MSCAGHKVWYRSAFGLGHSLQVLKHRIRAMSQDEIRKSDLAEIKTSSLHTVSHDTSQSPVT